MVHAGVEGVAEAWVVVVDGAVGKVPVLAGWEFGSESKGAWLDRLSLRCNLSCAYGCSGLRSLLVRQEVQVRRNEKGFEMLRAGWVTHSVDTVSTCVYVERGLTMEALGAETRLKSQRRPRHWQLQRIEALLRWAQ